MVNVVVLTIEKVVAGDVVVKEVIIGVDVVAEVIVIVDFEGIDFDMVCSNESLSKKCRKIKEKNFILLCR